MVTTSKDEEYGCGAVVTTSPRIQFGHGRFSLGGDRPLIQDHRAEPAWEQGASIPDSVPGRELR